MFRLFIVFFAIVSSQAAMSQSLSGLKIGDPRSSINNIGFDPSSHGRSGPLDIMKWQLPSGNQLSVTVNELTNTIVYIEDDWGRQSQGAISDFPDLLYGKTTLGDIRRRFGSNGMAFAERPSVLRMGDSFIYFNSYEVGDVIVTFATRIGPDDLSAFLTNGPKEGNQIGRLDAIMLASPEYVESTWGKPIKDPNYKPIEWK